MQGQDSTNFQNWIAPLIERIASHRVKAEIPVPVVAAMKLLCLLILIAVMLDSPISDGVCSPKPTKPPSFQGQSGQFIQRSYCTCHDNAYWEEANGQHNDIFWMFRISETSEQLLLSVLLFHKVVLIEKSSTTSNFLRHLKEYHLLRVEAFERVQRAAEPPSSARVAMTSSTQRTLSDFTSVPEPLLGEEDNTGPQPALRQLAA
ncbi:hypothetical protein lerEdw1_012945 [Lerista edwardsae]|nr:hypothetical protein lerEdw1_012945 [Lerista edwardsae]